jgi:hemerythrin-like domain-containing protein
MPELMLETDLSGDLALIHAIITRGLIVSRDSGDGFFNVGFSDEAVRIGCVEYLHTFCSITHAHHLTEEEAAFPYFREKGVEAPYDTLSREHAEMRRLLDEISGFGDEIARNSGQPGVLRMLVDSLDRLAAVWHPHIRTEEEYFNSEALNAVMSHTEQEVLARQYAEHTRRYAGPKYPAVPFMLFNLPPGKRAVWAKLLPEEVTEHLVQDVWKERWALMRPFLIDGKNR